MKVIRYPAPFDQLLRRKPLCYRRKLLELGIHLYGPTSATQWERANEWLSASDFRNLVEETDGSIVAERGSYRGNMTSFEVKHLMSRARLSNTPTGLYLGLNVSFTAQLLCTWNYIDLQVELEQFRNFVTQGSEDAPLAQQLAEAKGMFWKLDWRPASWYWKSGP